MPRGLHILILLIGAIGFSVQVSAQSTHRLLHEGDRYYEHEKYRAALQYYLQAGNPTTWKSDVKFRAAICQYEINEIDGAINLLAALVREGKTDPEVFLYLAKCYHQKNLFAQAVSFYKQYLRKFHDNTPLREWVKDELVRCANGINQKYAVEKAYVENMGAVINSAGDDYAPMPSPNFQERIYFTSAREDSEGGMLADNGTPDPKYGAYRTDIYYTEHDNGIWRSASPLDHVLNSRLNEELLGFSVDGQRMYYSRGAVGGTAELMIDTFSEASRVSSTGAQLGPYQPKHGDKDLFLFNDTIMLFASNRPGGYGGYDIYYSVRRKGRWREAANLGRVINSFYDDVSPHLAHNGRLLFISSNRLESIGGLDVFSSIYDDATAQWLPLINMGLPINSAGDETGFCLTSDGLKAYLASDRKSGFGKRDLYAAYFKEQVREQLTLSVPVTFIQLASVPNDTLEPIVRTPVHDVREYVISDLWFEPNDYVITPQNIKKLEVLANLLLIYPTLKIDLICHDVSSGPRSYDLFFSVKKSEQVSQYLIRKGISSDRIFVKGCGSYYPIATGEGQTVNNPAVDRLNRRIELHIYGAENQPVSLIMEDPNIPDGMRDSRGTRFDRMQDQVIYRVQIASVGQLFQHNVFDDYGDAMVEYDQSTRMYRYMIGMEPQFKNAAILRDALRMQGFADAFVVVYYKGKQLSRDEALSYSEQFPDLLNFLE